MKLNRKPLEAPKRKPTFWEWVLGSPKAFAVTWRMALIVPCVMFTLGAIVAFSYNSWLAWPTLVFTGLAYYNLWRNRQWFSTETKTTIGGMVWGIYDADAKPEDEVQFIDKEHDLREVEKR